MLITDGWPPSLVGKSNGFSLARGFEKSREPPFPTDSLETSLYLVVGYRDYDLGVHFRGAVEREPRSFDFSSRVIRRNGPTSRFMGPSFSGTPAGFPLPSLTYRRLRSRPALELRMRLDFRLAGCRPVN